MNFTEWMAENRARVAVGQEDIVARAFAAGEEQGHRRKAELAKLFRGWASGCLGTAQSDLGTGWSEAAKWHSAKAMAYLAAAAEVES